MKRTPLLPVLLALGSWACDGTGSPGIQGLDMTSPPDVPVVARDVPEVPLPDPGLLDGPADAQPDVLQELPQDVQPPDPGADPGVDPGTDPGGDPGADPGTDAPGEPRLTLIPDSVDFGFAAQGFAVQRAILARNDGTRPLVLSTVTLPEDSGGEFTVDASDALVAPIAPGRSAEIVLAATNNGGNTGTMTGSLRIESNDPANPVVAVALTAQRSGPPTCKLTLVPASLGFGTVAAGSTVERPLNVVNTGTGGIVLEGMNVYACAPGESAVGCSKSVGISKVFEVQLADGQSAIVQAGGSAMLRVRMNLAALGPTSAAEVAGRLVIGYSCPYGAPNPTTALWPDDCAPTDMCPPNLGATLGSPVLQADPAELLFPDTASGCSSSRKMVRLTNTTDVPVTLTALGPRPDCPSPGSFTLPDPPTLPREFAPGAALEVAVVFRPAAIGEARCDLQIETSTPEPAVTWVPLSGESSAAGWAFDRFVQVDRKADLLLVIDTSGSMMDVQGSFQKAVPRAMDAYTEAGTDAHAGVIGLGLEPTCPSIGELRGSPRLLDAQTIGTLADTVESMSRDSACETSTEAGLEALRLALTSPRIDDAEMACTRDESCPSPYRCVDGGCGGANRGFLRPDASLDVIVFSDEDDQSPDPVKAYATFLAGLKGDGGEPLVRLHAIAGDKKNGCSNKWHEAPACPRYSQVVEATGGTFTSICREDYTDALAAVGSIPYTPRTRFPLSQRPFTGSPDVTVNGKACTEGWTLSGDNKSLDFEPSGPCFPGPGAAIEVRYGVTCP